MDSHCCVQEPADESVLSSSSILGDGAMQTAGTARSVGVSTSTARSVHLSKLRLQRLKVCQKSPSSSVREKERDGYLFFLLHTVPQIGHELDSSSNQGSTDARLVESVLALAWQNAHVVAVLKIKINDANRARLATNSLW